MPTLEFESHSEAAAQREGFEETRDYLQRSSNVSNEECRKNDKLYEESQNERASLVPLRSTST